MAGPIIKAASNLIKGQKTMADLIRRSKVGDDIDVPHSESMVSPENIRLEMQRGGWTGVNVHWPGLKDANMTISSAVEGVPKVGDLWNGGEITKIGGPDNKGLYDIYLNENPNTRSKK